MGHVEYETEFGIRRRARAGAGAVRYENCDAARIRIRPTMVSSRGGMVDDFPWRPTVAGTVDSARGEWKRRAATLYEEKLRASARGAITEDLQPPNRNRQQARSYQQERQQRRAMRTADGILSRRTRGRRDRSISRAGESRGRNAFIDDACARRATEPQNAEHNQHAQSHSSGLRTRRLRHDDRSTTMHRNQLYCPILAALCVTAAGLPSRSTRVGRPGHVSRKLGTSPPPTLPAR